MVLVIVDFYQFEVLVVLQVVENMLFEVVLFVVCLLWLSVKVVDGFVVFENILNFGGEVFLLVFEIVLILKVVGMLGYVYICVDGEIYGLVGQGLIVECDIVLDVDVIM